MSEVQEGTATIDVSVRVTAKVASEFVTDELVCDHVARHRGDVLRAIERAVTREVELPAGWVDDDHEAFLVELEAVT